MEQTTEGRIREKEQRRRSRRGVRIKAMEAGVDQDARDRADEAIAKSEAHELLCTERWKNQQLSMERIERVMDRVEKAVHERVGKIPAAIISVLCAIVGFLAARVFPIG